MNLHDVNRGVERHRKPKRIGRGPGSGNGKTSGRGEKGARSRAGWSRRVAFQGGTMPMIRRIPKRGFNNRWALNVVALNVGDLEARFEAGAEVTLETLRACGLLRGPFDELKILGDGDLSKRLKVSAHRFSKSAAEKIRAAGGETVVLPGKRPARERAAEAEDTTDDPAAQEG